jgi:hypothetical protein
MPADEVEELHVEYWRLSKLDDLEINSSGIKIEAKGGKGGDGDDCELGRYGGNGGAILVRFAEDNFLGYSTLDSSEGAGGRGGLCGSGGHPSWK